MGFDYLVITLNASNCLNGVVELVWIRLICVLHGDESCRKITKWVFALRLYISHHIRDELQPHDLSTICTVVAKKITIPDGSMVMLFK